MSEASWIFTEMPPDLPGVDPTEGSHFSHEAIKGPAGALVRETIQNSLDAALPGQKVRVAFRFEDVPLLRMDEYLDGLAPHLQACDNTSILDNQNEKVRCLIIEDFGTRGLIGDPAQYKDPSDNNINDFYYFWRNVGRGQKNDTQRGSWGLGKSVFHASSFIKTIYGCTVRADDNQRLLMGQCELRIHELNGNRIAPYGYWGIKKDMGPTMPINDDAKIQAFAKCFEISRFDESGLSIVIPFLIDEIEPQGIVDAILYNYFYSVISNDLVVDVIYNGVTRQVSIDTFFNLMSGDQDMKSFKKTWEFALAARTLPDSERKHLASIQPGETPYWKKELFQLQQLDDLAKEFDAGRMVGIRVPVFVTPKGEDSAHTYFDVYMQRDKTCAYSDQFFIRKGIPITGVRPLRTIGIHALLVADDDPIASFLRLAENPAHTEWREEPRLKAKYEKYRHLLSFIKGSFGDILAIFGKMNEQPDKQALIDYFGIDLPEQEIVAPKPTVKKGTITEKPKPKPNTKKSLAIVTDLEDGVSISHNSKLGRIPAELLIKVAYDVRGRKPLNAYDPRDFQLNAPPIQYEFLNADIVDVSENRLRIRPWNDQYRINITGFDINRDIITKLTEV